MIRQDTAKEVSREGCHTRVKYKLNTHKSAKQNSYDKIFSDLRIYSKRLQKDIVNIIEERQEGTYLTGLLRGTRINPSACARHDGRIFKANKLPDDEPILAVSLLIDQSGSMYGKNIAQSMKMAMIIEDFCAGLGIPISIVGHDVSGDLVRLEQYIDFDDFTPERKYRLCNMYAGGCNRDGFALRYCLKRLESREEKTKLLILVSDGQPNDNGYGGEAAYKDLRSACEECRRKGITFFAAAIDKDKDRIKKIYGDSYLDITDLNTFPQKMVRIVKKFLIQ